LDRSEFFRDLPLMIANRTWRLSQAKVLFSLRLTTSWMRVFRA
jgi:hypothetical protein